MSKSLAEHTREVARAVERLRPRYSSVERSELTPELRMELVRLLEAAAAIDEYTQEVRR